MAKAGKINFLPMEARSVPTLPEGKQWRYEPKWDGFRCLAKMQDKQVLLISKSGKPLGRYFPDMVSLLSKLEAKHFLLDGELLIKMEEGYSFSELQMRLHPAASRVQKLAAAYPATYMIFDLLEDDKGVDLTRQPFERRRKALEQFYAKFVQEEEGLLLSPQVVSLEEAKQWITGLGVTIDGLIAKDINEIYQPEERVMRKYKFVRTADCIVGGFRYGTNSKLVGSLLLGLFDGEGLLHHVGFTSAIPNAEKEAVTRKLEKLVGPPGFTGRAPGAPSRWSTKRSTDWQPLKTKLVVEVSYDHITDYRFRHGTTLLRWRPDKAPRQCTFEQLARPVSESAA